MMSNKCLVIFTEQLESYGSFFDELIKLTPFTTLIIPFSEIGSQENKKVLEKIEPFNVIFAAHGVFFDKIIDQLALFIKDTYHTSFKNTIYLYPIEEFSEDELMNNKNNIFSKLSEDKTYTLGQKHIFSLNSQKDITTESINFIFYSMQIFKRGMTSFRLSHYISDSFGAEIAQELIKQQKEKIEKLHKELDKKNTTLMNELKMAKRIQLSLMPDTKSYHQLSDIRFGSKYVPMESLGGDFYDIIKITKNKYAFLVVDVSGRGVSSSLITSMAKVSFTSHTKPDILPNEVFSHINQEIYETLGDLSYYLTAHYTIIDLATGQLRFANAGHPPALLFHVRDHQIEKLKPKGTFIGIFKDAEYKSESIEIQEGDKILVMTDGILDAKNDHGVTYKIDQLEKFILHNYNLPAQDFIDALFEDVESYRGANPIEDDQTALCVDFISKCALESEE